MPASRSFCRDIKMPNFAWYQVSPPWKKTLYGGFDRTIRGKSIEDPWIKAPAAIITWESYPGISHGSGDT